MTREKYLEIAQSVPVLPCVFASEDGHATDLDANLPGSGLFNFTEGIPVDYATPPNEGGLRVLRKDLNAIGNLGTRELYLRQRGGYHTFDADVARRIDGYAEGAILDYFDPATGWLRKARCIKPYGRCFTPIDDADHGVRSDDPHWQFVDVGGRFGVKPMRLGEKKSVRMKFVGGSSDYLTVPCNCLGRIVFRASCNLYKPHDETPVANEHEARIEFAGAQQNSFTMNYFYSGWIKAGGYFKMGAFFLEGSSFRITVSNYDPQGIFLMMATFEYRECLK